MAPARAKSVILVWLRGGPTQLDTWDPKRNAPDSIRGDLGTIPSRTPGLHIGELMAETAKVTDKVAVLRAVVGGDSGHSSAGYQMLTGVPHVPLNANQQQIEANAAQNQWPVFGAIMRTLRRSSKGLPSAITLPKHLHNNDGSIWPGQGAGFLGRKFNPWRITCDPNQENFQVPGLALPSEVPALRFNRRRSLLEQTNRHLDSLERIAAVNQYDEQAQQAIALISASKSRQAFDLSQEPDSLRDRYTRTRFGQSVLLGRRLIEAGVSLVQVNWTKMMEKPNAGDWDTHTKNTESLKGWLMPRMDGAFATLISDLEDRGLLEETLVVCLGEFGRTPKINGRAGRDHWGHCYCVAMAGGGIRGGVVHGTSDAHAAYPIEGRVEPKDLAATVFHCMGYPPETTMVDNLGRPLAISQGRVIEQIL